MTEPCPLDSARSRVLALFQAGMHPRALSQADEALAAFPDDAWLHAVRADLLGHVNRADVAVPAAKHAISLEPDLGYAHRVLADALIDSDAKPQLAIQAAREAVRLDPTALAYYTLVRALVGWQRGTRAASEVSRELAREHPHSVLTPLALALVAMRRSGILVSYRWWWVVALVVLTRGGALVVFTAIWLFKAVRRVPYLKLADRYLRQALELDSGDPTARLLAVQVLKARYRFGQAVDQQVAVGALHAQLIDAGDVVRGIARRLAVGIGSACFVWMIPSFYAHEQLAGTISGPAVALVTAVLVAELRRRQTRSLPPALRAELNRQVLPLGAAAAAAALVVLTTWTGHGLGIDFRDGSALSAAIALAGFLIMCALFFRGRYPPS